ncbi:MAG TPA: 1-phosphofructokinase family hexose kinase [Bauldia sp.]|nr:1-phosphofructokinase family hexose kinase [Bauldia sp.]
MPLVLTLALNPAIDVSSEADTVRTEHKVRTKNETFDPGGGGINVARVVTELGGDVEVLCLAGGVTGEVLKELLARDRVHHRLIRIEGNTRISFTVHERSTGREYRFVASGPTLQPSELEACLKAVRTTEFRYFVASGSLPAGAPDDYLAEIARIVAEKGARFVLDSSGKGLGATLGHAPVYLVKPSHSELQAFVGRSLSGREVETEARALVKQGFAEMAAVSLGSEGAILATRDGVWRVPALKVEARSTVGAGDSFVAALTLGLAEGRAPLDALRLGIAAGAAAVLRPGTKLCSRENVMRYYEDAAGLMPAG